MLDIPNCLMTLWTYAKKAPLVIVLAFWHNIPDLYSDYVMHRNSVRPFICYSTVATNKYYKKFYCYVELQYNKSGSRTLFLEGRLYVWFIIYTALKSIESNRLFELQYQKLLIVIDGSASSIYIYIVSLVPLHFLIVNVIQ